MSFSKWKKQSKRFQNTVGKLFISCTYTHDLSQAAYKAGERQGRKEAELFARRAIELREMLAAKK